MPENLVSTDTFLFKVNNGNIRAMCEICSELTVKTPERCQCHLSSIAIVNFEHISHIVPVFLLFPLNSKCQLRHREKIKWKHNNNFVDRNLNNFFV